MPTNPASQNAYAPQQCIPPFSLQAQLQPVMMQKCITPFFSQEYCFSENPGLSASSGWPSAHSAPSEFFDTRCSVVARAPQTTPLYWGCCPCDKKGRRIGRGLSIQDFLRPQYAERRFLSPRYLAPAARFSAAAIVWNGESGQTSVRISRTA